MTAETEPTHPTQHLIPSTDGFTIAVHDWAGSGPTIVFCHATGFHGRVWDPIIADLRDVARCVAIDLRGHGDSAVAEGLVANGSDAWNDVLAVIDALELGSGLLSVGHSLGGGTIVVTEMQRPGTFADGWLVEPILIPKDYKRDQGPSLADLARRRREVFASRDEVFNRYMSRPPFSNCDPTMVRAYVDYGFRDLDDGTVILKCRGETEAWLFEHTTWVDHELLADVATPFTLVGTGDGGIPALIAKDAAEALANGRFQFEADLTHFAPLEDPAWAARHIRAMI